MIVTLLLTAGLPAEEQDGSFFSRSISSFGQDIQHLPSDVFEGSKLTLSKKENLVILGLAGAASIVMNQGADDDVESYFDRHEVFHGFTDRALNALGNPGFHFAATGLWYAFSVNNDDDLNKQRSWTMLKALSVTGLATVGLKAVRNNETPVGDDWAWPSGHTSSSFTVASVLHEFYGLEVGIPAYAAASMVGLRMMDQGDHWASDVVFGAALGWVVGHTIASEDKKAEIAGFKVVPFSSCTNRPTTGIALIKRF